MNPELAAGYRPNTDASAGDTWSPETLEVANLSGRAGQRSRGWRRLVRESFVAPAFPMCV